MRFSVNHSEHLTSPDHPDIKIVNFDYVTLEVCRTLSVREDNWGRSHAPVKQYFVNIIPSKNGVIPNMRMAISAAMTMLYSHVSISGDFTLWIKGRRYSKFSCSPTDATKHGIEEEMFYEIDSDMSFNREEWGLTQEQRKRTCSAK